MSQNLKTNYRRTDQCSKVQQPKKPNQSLNRLILSHFSTLLHLIKSLPSSPNGDEAGGLLATAVSESAKLLPWVLGARKHLRAYLKVLLELWTSASDSVRIAAFLAVRKTFVAGDESLKDICLKVSPVRICATRAVPDSRTLTNPSSPLCVTLPPTPSPLSI